MFGALPSTATGVTVSHAYAASGVFNVVLTVTDDVGAIGRATQSMTVTAGTGPTAGIVTVSPTPVVVNASAFFNASAFTAGSAPIVLYRFNYGDGTLDDVGVSPTQSHRFSAPGTYTVRVTATDQVGRTATATLVVTVSATGPVPAFTIAPNPAAVGFDVAFNASTSTTTGTSPITGYAWSFSDGFVAAPAQVITRRFTAAGVYVVTLRVTDASGASASLSQTVTVTP